MENLLEFNVIVTLQDDNYERLVNMGIEATESLEERIVKYSFDVSNIVEIRQTYVKYKGNYVDAVVATFTENNFETPALIIHYDEFKKRLNENNNKSSKA